jgi:hypothetical protein
MKPLARWTIGRVHPYGWEVLIKSVKTFPKIYPEFDLIICHNNLSLSEIKTLNNLNVKLYRQIENPNLPIANSGWKLIPSRISIKSHELWLDNDVLIWKRVPAIDLWLSSNTGIITQGLYGLYGKFKEFVNSPHPVCAGVFGLPPNFNFESKIINLYNNKLRHKRLDMPFDEQGLTAAIVTNIPGFIKIPMNQIKICENENDKVGDVCGVHFVGTNRGYKQAWKNWRLQYGLW